MKYFLIAGEASGDMHAAALVKHLREEDPEARFAGLGGDLMREEGVVLFQDYRKMAYMGVVAVLKHLSDIRRNFKIAKEALLKEQPDALILIDYPSFNLKMAAFCKQHLPATKIFYYIPPKAWAWKSWRVHKIAKLCDEVLGIFPFEPDFYKKYGYRCTYVGNPCVSTYDTRTTRVRENIIAILPGSRKSEISHCLPKMIAAAERTLQAAGREETPIVIAGAPGVETAFYTPYAHGYEVVFGETQQLLEKATAAIVNSGTATLEAALRDCPQVPVYHLACGWIAHLRPVLFPSPYFTLPNIILQREAVREKIAYRFTVDEVSGELTKLLTDEAYRQQQLSDYREIRERLGQKDAAKEAATIITRTIK